MVSEVQAGIGVVVALVVGFFMGSRYHKPPGVLERRFPQFFMCYKVSDHLNGQRPDCGDLEPQVGYNDFAREVATQAKAKAAAGRRPLLLSIGARDFMPDYYAYPPVLGNSSGEDYRLVLVEPDDYWNYAAAFARWAEEYPGEYIPLDTVQVLRVAVSANCAAREVTFHRISRALADALEAEDPDKARFTRYDWGASSLSKQWVERDLHEQFDQHNIANLTAYMEEVSVPCFSPLEVLWKVGATLSDLVMLTVDAEGEDRHIVKQLLELGARPAYIMFETNINYGSNMWVVTVLRRHGYVVGIHCHEKCPEWGSGNIVGVHQDFYSGP